MNPAASASPTQGYHDGTDHRLRTSYHSEWTAGRFPSAAAAAGATTGLRFNVVQQQHGRHVTSELVPVTEDAAAVAARYTTRTGAVNNNNGHQVPLPNAPGGGGGGGRGTGPHSVAPSIGRKQLLEDSRATAAAAKSVDIGECVRLFRSSPPPSIVIFIT